MALGTGGGLRSLPGTPAVPGSGAPLVPQHLCAAQSGAGRHPGDPGGVTQKGALFITDDSDTACHLDHITVQVANDRAQYPFDASRDSLPDERTLGLTGVPTRCQQAVAALANTLVRHCSASVRAEATRIFFEIAGAHDICPEVHYPNP